MFDGFSMPYRRDRNAHDGGILVYFRNKYYCEIIKTTKASAIFIEIHIKGKNCYSVVHITLINL